MYSALDTDGPLKRSGNEKKKDEINVGGECHLRDYAGSDRDHGAKLQVRHWALEVNRGHFSVGFRKSLGAWVPRASQGVRLGRSSVKAPSTHWTACAATVHGWREVAVVGCGPWLLSQLPAAPKTFSRLRQTAFLLLLPQQPLFVPSHTPQHPFLLFHFSKTTFSNSLSICQDVCPCLLRHCQAGQRCMR